MKSAYNLSPAPPESAYTINALNQLAPPSQFAHGARGNQTTVGRSPGVSRYFDTLGRVMSASSGCTTIYLTHDALDWLAGVKTGTVGTVRRVIWNGDELAGELTANANPIIYANGPEG